MKMKPRSRNQITELKKLVMPDDAGVCPAVFKTLESAPENVLPRLQRKGETDQYGKMRRKKDYLLAKAHRKGKYFTP